MMIQIANSGHKHSELLGRDTEDLSTKTLARKYKYIQADSCSMTSNSIILYSNVIYHVSLLSA